MSVEANKAFVREWVATAWNNGDLRLVDEKFTQNYTLHDVTAPNQVGREPFKLFIGGFLSAFPDVHVTIEDLFGEGDKITWRWTMTGTQTGALGTIPATGKSMKIGGTIITRFVDGLWAEDYVYYDFFGLLQQLGVVPALA